MKSNIIVFGGKGQLGQSLQYVINRNDTYGFNFVFLSSKEANLMNLFLSEEVGCMLNSAIIL